MRYTVKVMEPFIPTPKREPGVYQGTPKSPLEESEESQSPRLIRTMKIDVAEAIKQQNETFVSIALAEEKKQLQKRGEALAAQANIPPKAPKPIGRLLIITIFLLVLVAIGPAYVFVLPRIKSSKTGGVPSTDTGFAPSTEQSGAGTASVSLAPALIPPQFEKRFALEKETPDHVFAMIAVERTGGMLEGTIKNFYFTEEVSSQDDTANTGVIHSKRLLSFANAYAPDILIRSLETPFMAGLLGESGSLATPFLVLKVSSYDTGFAGMLVWETSLPRFFDTLFGTKIQARGGSESRFRDITVSGKDARALGATSGATVVYTFADPNTIVIAGSKSALEILIPHLAK